MTKYLVYVPDRELFDAKYALLQFAGISSDENGLVAIETEADMVDVDTALKKTGKDYLLLRVRGEDDIAWKGDADLAAIVETLTA